MNEIKDTDIVRVVPIKTKEFSLWGPTGTFVTRKVNSDGSMGVRMVYADAKKIVMANRNSLTILPPGTGEPKNGLVPDTPVALGHGSAEGHTAPPIPPAGDTHDVEDGLGGDLDDSEGGDN